MKNLIVQNWRAKAFSLLVAFAVWWLVKGHVQQSERSFSPIPGAQQGSVRPALPLPLPAVADAQLVVEFHRLLWYELESPDGGLGQTRLNLVFGVEHRQVGAGRLAHRTTGAGDGGDSLEYGWRIANDDHGPLRTHRAGKLRTATD